VFAAEVEGQAPLAESLEADQPVGIDYVPSFVDGIGGPRVEPEMFELARDLLAGSLLVSLEEVAGAIRLLVERVRVVAEGAGGAAVAAATSGAGVGRRVVAVVSGGNLDSSALAAILAGGLPGRTPVPGRDASI
jgi:threonine dehydratase